MILHVISVMRNEEIILPYFLRYYSTIADKIIILLDTTSTDRTREMALADPLVELYEVNFNKIFSEEEKVQFLGEAYRKHSRGVADWVICADSDEIFYKENLRKVLEYQRLKGARVLKSTAYLMLSEVIPSTTGQIYEESNRGLRNHQHDKTTIFDPALDIKFKRGEHDIYPIEGVPVCWARIMLLHYRCLSRQYFIDRTTTTLMRYGGGQSQINQIIRQGLRGYDRDIKKDLPKIIF